MAYSNQGAARDIYESLGISDKPFDEWWKEQESISSAAVTPKVSRSAERQEVGEIKRELGSKIKSDNEIESLSALMLDQTMDILKKNGPLIAKNWKQFYDDPSADKFERAAGKSILTGALLPIKNEIEMSLAKNPDGSWNSKRAEDYYKRTGVRLLSQEEIALLPSDQADIVRSYQGDLIDKAAHGVTNLAHGLAMPFIQAYDNLGVAAKSAQKGDTLKAYGQAWASLLDIPVGLVVGLGPMVARLGTDYSKFAQEDPIGAYAAKAGARHMGRRAAAGVKGALEKVEVPREKTWQDFEKVERPEDAPQYGPTEPVEAAIREGRMVQVDTPTGKVAVNYDGQTLKETQFARDLPDEILESVEYEQATQTPPWERAAQKQKAPEPVDGTQVIPKEAAEKAAAEDAKGAVREMTFEQLEEAKQWTDAEKAAWLERREKARREVSSAYKLLLGEEMPKPGRKVLQRSHGRMTVDQAAQRAKDLRTGKVPTENLPAKENQMVQSNRYYEGAFTQALLTDYTVKELRKMVKDLQQSNPDFKVPAKTKKAEIVKRIVEERYAADKRAIEGRPNAEWSPLPEVGVEATKGTPKGPAPLEKGTLPEPQYRRGGLRGARAAMREQALGDKDARFSPAQKITDAARWAAKSEQPLVRTLGERTLQQQQSGVLGWVPGLGNKFAGWEPEWVEAYKKGDEATRADQVRMFDQLAKIRNESPEVFALYKEIMTEGQEQAGLRYNLLKDISDITAQLGPEGKEIVRLQKLLESGKIKPETYNKRAAKLAEFKDLWDLALREQDPKKIDKLRGEAVKQKLLKEETVVQRRKRFVRPKEYIVAASRLAKNAPTMAEFYYDGAPMSTLKFLLDSRNKKLDPRKVTVKLLDDAEAYRENPALLQLAQEHVGNLLNIRRTLDEAGAMMGELYGKEGTTILGPETLLNNFISGYFPGGKIKKFFDPEKTKDGGAARSLIDVQNHLKMKTEGRRQKRKPTRDELSDATGEEIPPPTLAEFRKVLADDQNAYRIYSQYAANVYAMANRAKMISNIKKMGLGKRIFKSRAEIPQGYDPYYVQLKSKAGSGKSRLVEFGELDGYWVPKTLERNLRMFQEASVDGLGMLASLQNIFKQTHTVMGIPYFANTATGLAVMQMLDGGTPLSILDGMRSLSKKDKFYEAYRDAGFMFDPDRLFGLESGNRSLIMRLTSDIGSKIYNKVQDKPRAQEFFNKAEDLFIQLEDPTKFKKTKTAIKAATVGAATAGLAAYTGFLPPTTAAGAAVLGLGALQGLALVKGREGAMMLDQGGRMGSFKRHVYTQAKILSDRQRIPLERAVDVILNDPQARRKAAQHATYINIDYGYLPEGIETQSKYMPNSPFIKFATRATEMMMDMPVQNPIMLSSLNAAQRAYFNNLSEDQMSSYELAPFNTAGLAVPMGRGQYINLGYMIPMHAGIMREAYALPSAVLGYGGVGPRSAAEYVARQGREGMSGFPLGTGYVAPFMQAAMGIDRYGRKLDQDQLLPQLASGFLTSVPYYARQLEQAFYAGADKNGMTPGEVFVNAIALKVTPLMQMQKQREYAKNAYNRRANEIKARYNKTLKDHPEDEKRRLEAQERLLKDKAQLEQYLYNAILKNTKSYLNRTEVPTGR